MMTFWQKKTKSRKKVSRKFNAKPVYGIYATKIKEKQKYNEKYRIGKKRQVVRGKKKFINYNKIKTNITTNFIITNQLNLGEKLCIQTQNLKVLRNHLMSVRRNHAVYNIYHLLLNLRRMFYLLSYRLFYKRSALVNYVTDKKVENKQITQKELHKYPKRNFVVTWKKWIGGVLTNFKMIAKRLLARKRTKSQYIKKNKFNVSYPRNIPKLPSMLISAANCHWSLNESRLLRIPSVQIVNTNYLGAFGDINIGINVNYYPLLSFTTLLTECASMVEHYNSKWHKNKLMRRLRQRSIKKMVPFTNINIYQNQTDYQ